MTDTLTPEQLRNMVEQEKQSRAQAFAAAFKALTEEHQCDLVASAYIDGDGRIRAQIQIVAK